MAERTDAYLIVKRDLYYRPNSQGYTGIRDNAGRYTLAEVAVLFPNRDSPNQDGMTFMHEDDGPEFTSACFHDLKAAHLTKQRDAARTRVTALEETLRAQLGWLRHWQADAEAGLKPTAESLTDAGAALTAALQPGEAQVTVAVPDALRSLTFAVQHNPNCPSPWLVRLPGCSAIIDFKPYSGFGMRAADLTDDKLGFGKTFNEAAFRALAHKP